MLSEGSIGVEVTDLLKRLYTEKKEAIEYLIKFGSPIERAKASLIKDIANGYKVKL